jgi:hypothetical protein
VWVETFKKKRANNFFQSVYYYADETLQVESNKLAGG